MGIAGLDGYDPARKNTAQYAEKSLELPVAEDDAMIVNREIQEMLQDILHTDQTSFQLEFITPSRFAHVLQ